MVKEFKFVKGPYLLEGTFVCALHEIESGSFKGNLGYIFSCNVQGNGPNGASPEELIATARLFQLSPSMAEAIIAIRAEAAAEGSINYGKIVELTEDILENLL